LVEKLASYRRCCQRLQESWPGFVAKREQFLQQEERYGNAAEKVAENILLGLFTDVLDWHVSDLNFQISRADIVITRLGVKHLLLEAKRPGLLVTQHAVDVALNQARCYADNQAVRAIGISDGRLLYAVDVVAGGFQPRVCVDLAEREAPLDLWWLSVDGIYRERADAHQVILGLPGRLSRTAKSAIEDLASELLHPKYELPARCFAYVGAANDPRTWHLPYLLQDGGVDRKRLPKAIQAVLSNYRGTHLSSVPERAIPEVLVRLGRAAASEGHLDERHAIAAPAYRMLVDALRQWQLLERITFPTGSKPSVAESPLSDTNDPSAGAPQSSSGRRSG